MLNRIRQILEVSIVRELALLFGGVFLGVILTLHIQNPVLNQKRLIMWALVILLILSGSGGISKLWHWFNIRRRKTNFKVGILNDMGWDLKNKENYTTGTDISPEDWEKEIEELVRINGIKISVELIKAENYFDKYNAIINPYGGVYPEYDLKNFKTLNEICNYIKEGGLFVNVADIPGYFACNPSIKPWRKIDTALREAPYAYKNLHEVGLIIPIKRFPLFHLVPFTRELGVDVYKIEDEPIHYWGVLEFEKGFETKSGVSEISVKVVHRAAVVKEYLDPIIKSKETTKIILPPQKVTPLFIVKYGDGKLLASLIWENHNKEVQNELRKMLAELVINLIKRN